MLKITSQQPCAKPMKTSKCNIFIMIYKLLKLILFLPVASASVWTCFFSYKSCEEFLDIIQIKDLIENLQQLAKQKLREKRVRVLPA